MSQPRPDSAFGLLPRGLRKIETEFTKRTFGVAREWIPGRRSVSFTFDDFPESAAELGAGILESFGVRGTFYTSFGLAGCDSESGVVSSLDTIGEMNSRGHEIACHTFGHIDCSITSDAEIARDCAKNREAAKELGVPALTSFSYPFGGISREARSLIMRQYHTARSAWSGINRARFDAGALRVVPLMSRDGVTQAFRSLDKLVEGDGWLLFQTHDVTTEPSMWGCQPSLLTMLCERAISAGVEILPVRDVQF